MNHLPGRVRDAAVPDAPALARIRVTSWRSTYAGIVPASILDHMDLERNTAFFAARIAEPDGNRTLVIEDEPGRVVGYALAGPCADPDPDAVALGEIQAVYLDPEARGRGFGRMLLEASMTTLAGAGCAAAVLWVLTPNLAARRFYERLGFGFDGAARMVDFDGTPIEEIRYRRTISGSLYHRTMTSAPPVAVPVPEPIRRFLLEPRVASVGTTGEDGTPHQAVAWYRLDPDDRLLLNSRLLRRWPADLSRDGRVSLTVIDDKDSLRWVGLSGVVETIIDDVESARDDICALAARYRDDRRDRLAAFRTQARISFRIRIIAIYDHLAGS